MESRRMRSRSQALKWACYAAALFVCAALQTTPGLFRLGQAKPLFILPLCLAVAVYEGEFAGALFGAVGGLLWDYTAGRTVGMLALELLLLCFALSVLVQVYLQGSTWNFALIGTGTALVVLSLDWLFFYYMPGYSWALSRWLTFVLPSAVMTLVPSLVLFSLVTVGYSSNALGGAGGPLAVLIIAIVAAELGKAVSKETRVDILVTPLVTIFAGVGLSMLIAAPIGAAASQVGTLIMWATEQAPLVMGILVSVIVGVALTLPISSAAICAALGLTGLAGGAAVAGCCAQMVGFAVMSYKENGVGGLVSQGLGTSMLQMGNIIKNPRIWIAPTLASAITGPLATCLFHFEMNGAAVSSGMGTCGLVGQIGVYTGWVSDIAAGTKAAITPMDWAAMVLLCFVLPAVLSVVFCAVERKLGWIKEGDLKLN